MDYVRYLKSKQTVDDRAVNLRVLTSLEESLYKYGNSSKEIKVLEVGSGIGTMCTRLYDRKALKNFTNVEYTLVDVKCNVLQAARKHLITSFGQSGQDLEHEQQEQQNMKGGISIHRDRDEGNSVSIPSIRIVKEGDEMMNVSFHFRVGDALVFANEHKGSYDLVIGAAVLDLWNIDKCMPVLLSALSDDGLKAFYFPINFDGVTDFYPCSTKDATMEKVFHRSMGQYHSSVDNAIIERSHTGRRLLPLLYGLNLNVCDVVSGSSAWIVSPEQDDEGYIGDEAYFLHCIIDFIEGTMSSAYQQYISERRKQIDACQLVYTAHNMDIFGRVKG